MKLQTLTPILYTEDLRGTIDFYTNVLGFACKSFVEDWGWASLCRDEVAIMLALPNAHVPFERPIFTGSFYFKTDAVDALWQSLQNQTRVCYPLEDFEYGMREFAIYDNNGYVLQFGQELHS